MQDESFKTPRKAGFGNQTILMMFDNESDTY